MRSIAIRLQSARFAGIQLASLEIGSLRSRFARVRWCSARYIEHPMESLFSQSDHNQQAQARFVLVLQRNLWLRVKVGVNTWSRTPTCRAASTWLNLRRSWTMRYSYITSTRSIWRPVCTFCKFAPSNLQLWATSTRTAGRTRNRKCTRSIWGTTACHKPRHQSAWHCHLRHRNCHIDMPHRCKFAILMCDLPLRMLVRWICSFIRAALSHYRRAHVARRERSVGTGRRS